MSYYFRSSRQTTQIIYPLWKLFERACAIVRDGISRSKAMGHRESIPTFKSLASGTLAWVPASYP